MSVERLAVQLQARCRVGITILHRSPCGAIDSCNDPVFQRYYALVGALQAGYGQALYIGERLDEVVISSRWKLVASELRVVEHAAPVMARLHAMNIRTWAQDALARRLFDPDEIARVQDGLDHVASGDRPAPPVRNALRQIVASPA